MKLFRSIFLMSLFSMTLFAQDDLKKEQLVNDYYEKGVSLAGVQKDSAYYYLDHALSYAKELKNYSDAMEILIQSIVVSGIHYDLKSYRVFLDGMEALLNNEKVIAVLDDYDYYQNRFIYEEGNYLDKLKDFNGAKKRFLKLYKVLNRQDVRLLDTYGLSILVNTSNFLAGIYTDTGKYDLAENYFDRSLSYIKNNEKAEGNHLLRATDRLRSKLYIDMGKREKADSILKHVLSEYKAAYQKNKLYKNSVVVVYQRLVENLMQQDSLKKALDYLDESQNYLLEEDPFYKQALLFYGDIYSKQNRDRKAMDGYRAALASFQEYRQNKPHQDIAEVHGKIAELYLKQKNYPEGLERIKKAFNTAGSNVLITDLDQNPDPDGVFSKTQLLHLLDVKLQLVQGSYQITKEKAYLDAVLKTNRDILLTFDKLKSQFDSKLDKQFLAEKAYPIFHRMLETAHSVYQKDRSSETLQLALNIAEKNKDFVLLEALRNAQATRYGDVPQKVLDREAQLRAEITHVEKQLFDATESDSGFSDDLFELKQEYYGLLDTIKTKYPKYHDLKYRTVSLNMDIIRDKLLDNNGTLVSYTMTDDYLYAIILNGSKENFLKLPFLESDREDVRNFYSLLSTPSIGRSERDITDLGERLYEKTLKKPLEGFDAEILTIVPDGELHYLPFDMLRKEGSYLLRTKNTGYGNSVASLLELKEKKSSEKNRVLAFAPSFNGVPVANDDRQFGKLRYNDDEVSKVGAFYDTETVLDQMATLTRFKAKASRFNILHLATHASANDEYPDYSYLAFSETKDSTTGNILYVKDLYSTTLNADMVTLSACQTGIGKLQKGQGMLSLSKGFYYAGAKSLINTLWKINDKSTVKLMEYFYEGLSMGKSKTQALREAKLKYLENTNDDLLRHPYYWAAFVVSGDVSPITETHYWWYIGAGVLFFVVLFFISRRKGKIKEFRRVVLRAS